MTSFLIFIVLALVAISVWQITKIFDLSQVGADNSQVATDQDNNINGYLMFGFLVFIYVITIVCFAKWGDLPLVSNSASEHGKDVDQLMIISMALIFFVQTVTQALLYYFAFKYRGEKGKKALFYADNDRLEFIWTVIPVIVLAGLILYGLFTWTTIMNVSTEDDPLVVELYAQQFNWKVRYAGEDNTLGGSNVRFLTDYEGKNVTGIDDSDPSGMDDVVSTTEMHLPVGRKVLFKMRSQDVLHSAYMPHFRAQMNCVPGMITQFSFTPIMTTEDMRQTDEMKEKVARINRIRNENNKTLAADEQLEPYTFDYLLLCNKICGSSHYNMQLKIVVESEEDYKKWMSEQLTFAQVIQ
jgi:cytochrome c oxidase subunit 2